MFVFLHGDSLDRFGILYRCNRIYTGNHNGERVSPWLQEIDATGLPSTFWVHYSGYFRGKTPDPQHSPGYMVVQTYMTQYKSR